MTTDGWLADAPASAGADATTGRAAAVDFAGIQALLSRPAGYSVARTCLEVQAEAELLDPSLRTPRGTRLAPAAVSWFVGALGEIHVGELLRALGPEWLVLHSVPIGTGATDVDHLLIGPAGVFSVTTKHHPNRNVRGYDRVLGVGRTKTRDLQAADFEAREVSARLTRGVGFAVAVDPLLVVVGARSVTDHRSPSTRRTAVVSSGDLIGWLRSRPVRLSSAERGLVAMTAEEPLTWHVDPRAADTTRVMPRFDRLRAELGVSVPVLPAARISAASVPSSHADVRPVRRPKLRRARAGEKPAGADPRAWTPTRRSVSRRARTGVVAMILVPMLIAGGSLLAAWADQMRNLAGYDTVRAQYARVLATQPHGYDRTQAQTRLAAMDAVVEQERRSLGFNGRTAALTESITSDLASVQRSIRDWTARYSVQQGNLTNRTGTDAEAALIRVSGGIASFAIDQVCPASGAGGGAVACVWEGPTVHVPPELARLSNAQLLRAQGQDWRMVMTHEFAHVIQQKYRPALESNADFVRLFGAITPPPWYTGTEYGFEASADCMAQLRVPGYVAAYPVDCTPERRAFAQRIWEGAF